MTHAQICWGLSWFWLYCSWIYNYVCNQFLSPLKLWVWIPLRWGVLDTTLCDKVCQRLPAGGWFFLGTPVSSNNKSDGHNVTEILLKVALNTITLTLNPQRILLTGKVLQDKDVFAEYILPTLVILLSSLIESLCISNVLWQDRISIITYLLTGTNITLCLFQQKKCYNIYFWWNSIEYLFLKEEILWCCLL